MKFLRLASILMLSACAVAFGQSSDKPAAASDAQKPAAQPVATSDAQKSFELLKTLAGTWKGPITTDIPAWSTDQLMPLSIRVASHGNALIHELSTPGPEITVFYLDSDRLTLIHYCDYGNRPHLVARPSADGKPPADGKIVEFDLVDAPGSNQVGHITHGVFTLIDANHHIEDWTFLLADGTPVHARMDFKRVQ
jgi:hypothetical protein